MMRALLWLGACVPTLAAGDAEPAPPNILYVMTDDMGWGDVGFTTERYQPGAGGKTWTVDPPRTPNIDKLANGDNTMVLHRWYTSSAICSPTRAAVLTGRAPGRSCIDRAEGCGQNPAWTCDDKYPLPATEFTVAEAAKQKGYATLFIGKWHLGDFWNKGEKGGYALKRWPASNPSVHGFDEWHATEASAASTTPNCACKSEWIDQGEGCIVGGGTWQRKAYKCTNYWGPADLDAKGMPTRGECRKSKTISRDCVANLTSKIEGDDTQHMMDVFEEFLHRKGATGTTPTPWFAQLSVHTNHGPHPSLPEWYHAYKTAGGDPAGDYLGTISQMDDAIGRMVKILKKAGDHDNTLLWFSAGDNGAFTKGNSRPSGQNAASNGLRQGKASLFEGGIRVGGFIQWPGVITKHVDTYHTAVTSDILPTVLDLLGLEHPHPDWFSDGVSLLPLITGRVPAEARRQKAIGFSLQEQTAWLNETTHDGTWKIVANPRQGDCADFLEPYGSMKNKSGPFLFNLTADPTESVDLCDQEPSRCSDMKAGMASFMESIDHSRKHESGCEEDGAPVALQFGSPQADGLDLVVTAGAAAPGECLTLMGLVDHALPVIGTCGSPGSKWTTDARGNLGNLAVPTMCLKVHDPSGTQQAEAGRATAADVPCAAGGTIWLGPCSEAGAEDPAAQRAGLRIDAASGRLVAGGCSDLCAVRATENNVFHYSSAALGLGSCSSEGAFSFSVVEASLPASVVV